jgi:hypothetical protein
MRVEITIMAAAFLFSILSTSVHASSCSATNDSGGMCSIDCPAGQSAQCTNGTGSSSPVCECEGSANFKPKFTTLKVDPKIGTLSTGADKLTETDLLSVVNAKLAALPAAHLSDRCGQVPDGGQICHDHWYPCVFSATKTQSLAPGDAVIQFQRCLESVCSPTYKNVCNPVMGTLTSNGVFVKETEAKVQIVEPNWDDIPTSFFGLKATYNNCNPKDQSFSFTQNVKLTVGSKLTKTQSIKSSQEISASVGFEYSVKGSVAAKFSREINVGSAEEASDQTEQSFSYQETVNVPAMHRVVYTHEFAQKNVDIRYIGNIQVTGGVSPNLSGVQSLAEALPNPADRMFSFAGIVSNSTVYEGITNNNAVSLTDELCKDLDATTTEPYVRSSL